MPSGAAGQTVVMNRQTIAGGWLTLRPFTPVRRRDSPLHRAQKGHGQRASATCAAEHGRTVRRRLKGKNIDLTRLD